MIVGDQEEPLLAKDRGNRLLKLIDRWLGIPLVFILGLFRRKSKTVPSIRRVAFFISSALGDTLLISGIIRDLKRAEPDAEIIVFAGSNHEAARLIGAVDRVIAVKVTRLLRSIKKIRQYPCDIWIDTGQWARLNALYSLFAPARFKIGFLTPGQHKHYLFDRAIPHSSHQHEMDNFRGLLGPLHIETGLAPAIEVNGEESKTPGRPYAVCHPFPGGYRAELKKWPGESWLGLIHVLLERGYDIYLTGGKGDREDARQLMSHTLENAKIHVVAGLYSFRQTAALIKGAELVVSVNTGTMHLAATLGRNLVALHGPTDFRRWGPLNENSISLTSKDACAPCLNLGFEYACKYGGCMKSITLPEVVNAVDRLLAGKK